MKFNSMLLDPNSASTQPPGASGGGGDLGAGSSPIVSPGTSSGSSSPAAPQYAPPAGHRLVADADYGRYEGAYKALSGMGFEKPDDLAAYKPMFEVFKNRKDLDPALLANALAGRREEPKTNQPQNIDPEKIKADLLRELRSESAWKSHADRKNKLPDQLKAELIKMLGKDDETLTPLLLDSAQFRLEQARAKAYASNQDVLSGTMPGEYTDDLVAETLKGYADLVKKLNGNRLADIGKAANAARQSTAAGNAGGQGKPGGADGAPDKRSREAKLAYVQAALEANKAAKR
jgi:hypothetical protein